MVLPKGVCPLRLRKTNVEMLKDLSQVAHVKILATIAKYKMLLFFRRKVLDRLHEETGTILVPLKGRSRVR